MANNVYWISCAVVGEACTWPRLDERVLSDRSRTNRETINLLWDILGDPHLNQALGLPHNSRMRFGPH